MSANDWDHNAKAGNTRTVFPNVPRWFGSATSNPEGIRLSVHLEASAGPKKVIRLVRDGMRRGEGRSRSGIGNGPVAEPEQGYSGAASPTVPK